MQHLTKRLLQVGAAALVGVGGYGMYKFATRVVRQDPLAQYKKPKPEDMPENVAIQMKGNEFRRYDEGKPQASCNVDVMEIQQNRQVYNFQGVSKGKVAWKNANYTFEAQRGNWNGFTKLLVLNGKSKLKGTDFNFESDEVRYDENGRVFRVPGEVTGRAYGGKLKVASIVYSLDDKGFETGAGEWVGIPPKEFIQESPADQRRTWDISFDKTKAKGDDQTYTNAKATDGDMIITAPNVTLNRKTDVLTATGRVKYFSNKANVIADKIVVYRKEKRAVITGNVTMLVKPKSAENDKLQEVEIVPVAPVVPESIAAGRPKAATSVEEEQKRKEEQIRSAKNLRDFPLTILGDQIEYWYKKGERRATVNGKPQAKQELPEGAWRYAWSKTARYDGEKEVLYLDSNKSKRDVIIKNSIGDNIEAESAVMSTKENDDEYEYSNGTVRLSTIDDDIPKDDKKKGGGGGTTGGGTPPPLKGNIGGRRV